MSLDLDYVRAQFPALAGDMIFMDNAGGAQCLASVAERVSEYLLTTNVQTGASYATSQASTDRVAQARARMAQLVNAAEPAEIVMGTNASTLMKFLAESMASTIREGDEIIVTSMDHASHISPFLKLAERGALIRWWRFDSETFRLSLDDLRRLLTPRTRLVAMTHCSNILGGVTDVTGAASLAQEVGAEIAVDGVAFAPHRQIDVQALGVDYYFLSLYKLFGPHQAMMYGRRASLERLDSIYQYFMGRDRVPHKLEPGNCNYELAWGSTAIVDYLESLGGNQAQPIAAAFEKIAAHEASLTRQLVEGLARYPEIRLIGPDIGANDITRVPTVSFIHDRHTSPAIVEAIDPAGIGVRHGDFYARDVVEQLGLGAKGGVVRVSLVHYNTEHEVDRFLDALDRALGQLG